MSQNMASAIYNDLNLPDHVYMQSGNGMNFRYLADGRRIETSSSAVGTPLILPPPPPPGSPAPPPVEFCEYPKCVFCVEERHVSEVFITFAPTERRYGPVA